MHLGGGTLRQFYRVILNQVLRMQPDFFVPRMYPASFRPQEEFKTSLTAAYHLSLGICFGPALLSYSRLDSQRLWPGFQLFSDRSDLYDISSKPFCCYQRWNAPGSEDGFFHNPRTFPILAEALPVICLGAASANMCGILETELHWGMFCWRGISVCDYRRTQK